MNRPARGCFCFPIRINGDRISWAWICALIGAWVGCSGYAALAEENLERFEFLQIRMGVPVRILVYAPDSASAIKATDAAYARLKALDRTLSDYDPDSELMQLCAHEPVGEPVAVSDDLFTVLSAAKELSEQTQGAFDVSLGPVIRLWRIARRRKKLPDEKDIREALSRTGSQFVEIDREKRTVTLLRPGMQLDFGGIAKGYAADEAFKVLQKHGLSRVLIAVAGDIRVGDPPPDRTAWRVEVEDKTRPQTEESPKLVLELTNRAVSTSGDTYQFLEIDGVRYSHIVDPKTGIGLTTPGSVTVIAPTGMQADSLASAVSILGPQRGLELIQRTCQCECFLAILNSDGQRSEWGSPGWAEYLMN